MRVVLIPDTHLCSTPPSLRTDSYPDDVLDKLRFAVEYANSIGADALVQAGDLFHLKAPTRTSHKLAQLTIDVFSEADMPVLVVPGNHDMSHDRLESLPSQPLGTVCKAPGIDLLMGPHPTLPIFGLPYLHDWATLLPLWMDQYRNWRDTNHVLHPLMVTHAPIFPPGETVIYEYIDGAEWATLMGKGDVHYGHIHDSHGAYSPIPGVVLCNNGALSRGSLHESSLKRKPAITVWDSENLDAPFTRVEVPHKPVEAVFRMDLKEDIDTKQAAVTEFLAGVESTTLEVLSVEQVLAHVSGMDLSPATLVAIRECLEHVSGCC